MQFHPFGFELTNYKIDGDYEMSLTLAGEKELEENLHRVTKIVEQLRFIYNLSCTALRVQIYTAALQSGFIPVNSKDLDPYSDVILLDDAIPKPTVFTSMAWLMSNHMRGTPVKTKYLESHAIIPTKGAWFMTDSIAKANSLLKSTDNYDDYLERIKDNTDYFNRRGYVVASTAERLNSFIHATLFPHPATYFVTRHRASLTYTVHDTLMRSFSGNAIGATMNLLTAVFDSYQSFRWAGTNEHIASFHRFDWSPALWAVCANTHMTFSDSANIAGSHHAAWRESMQMCEDGLRALMHTLMPAYGDRDNHVKNLFKNFMAAPEICEELESIVDAFKMARRQAGIEKAHSTNKHIDSFIVMLQSHQK